MLRSTRLASQLSGYGWISGWGEALFVIHVTLIIMSCFHYIFYSLQLEHVKRRVAPALLPHPGSGITQPCRRSTEAAAAAAMTVRRWLAAAILLSVAASCAAALGPIGTVARSAADKSLAPWLENGCGRVRSLLRRKQMAVRALARIVKKLGDGKRLYEMAMFRVLLKELDEAEQMAGESFVWLDGVLHGDYKDVVSLQRSSLVRLEALRAATLKEEKEYKDIVRAHVRGHHAGTAWARARHGHITGISWAHREHITGMSWAHHGHVAGIAARRAVRDGHKRQVSSLWAKIKEYKKLWTCKKNWH